MSSSRSMMSTVLRVSRSPVGSSSSSSSGLFASARAIVTRCCSPPESSDGRCSSLSRSPTLVRRSTARMRRWEAESLPRIVIGSSTFSNADIVAIRLNVWKTKPMLLRRSDANIPSEALEEISLPNSSISPPVVLSMHPMMLRSVVLPPPEGPRRTTNSPFIIGNTSLSGARVMSLSATT
mmetsp:Transcript_26021/g.62077  ORF Transcript_26021/g.62077 Transcript_26021/m.62077 type:complete len:180 (-) Transcript_26021:244-783(-)